MDERVPTRNRKLPDLWIPDQEPELGFWNYLSSTRTQSLWNSINLDLFIHYPQRDHIFENIVSYCCVKNSLEVFYFRYIILKCERIVIKKCYCYANSGNYEPNRMIISQSTTFWDYYVIPVNKENPKISITSKVNYLTSISFR